MVVIHLAHPFRNHYLDLSILMFDQSNLVFIKHVFACIATYVRGSKFLCINKYPPNILPYTCFSRMLFGVIFSAYFGTLESMGKCLMKVVDDELVLPVRLLWPLI